MGIMAGILAGPWILGRFLPDTYQRLFVGGQAVQEQLTTFDQQRQHKRQGIIQSGASPTALAEFDQQSQPDRQLLETQLQLTRVTKANQWLGQSVAMLFVVIFLLFAEKRINQPIRRGRLQTARHALLAVWIAMALAGPMFRHVPLVFAGLLVLLAIVATLAPIDSEKGSRLKAEG